MILSIDSSEFCLIIKIKIPLNYILIRSFLFRYRYHTLINKYKPMLNVMVMQGCVKVVLTKQWLDNGEGAVKMQDRNNLITVI